LLLLAGCCYPVGEKVDGTVCDLAARPHDLQPLLPADQGPAVPPAASPGPTGKATEPGPTDGKVKGKRPVPSVPPELLPGGPVPPIDLGKGPAERQAALAKLYPPLPPLGDEPVPSPGPEGQPLTLADLQRLALSNSPQVRQAAAYVEAQRGAAIQAGLPPNPTVGYQGDTVGTTGGWGYQGAFIEQVIKTANKLQLSRAVAAMDLRNAEVALQKAKFDLTTRVRAGYFAVLVAEESVRVNRALVRFTAEVYDAHLTDLRKGVLAAPYEPLYLRSLAVQARAALVQARNRRTSAWKRLSAALGLPGMPLTQLAGRVDVPIPVYEHPEALAHVLSQHTDLRTAENDHAQAQLRLKLAQITPVPDVSVRLLVQKDRTGPPFEVAPSVQVSVPVPIWDRNQGGIHQAQAQALQASEEAHRARADLTDRLAEAFERYQSNRALLGFYRDQILPDQVRYYRGVYARFMAEGGTAPAPGVAPPPGFLDLIVAQQNLAGTVGTYLTTLGALWQAVVDVADLLQTDDLFQLKAGPVPTQDVAAIPALEQLPGLPCCHPCAPLPGLHHRVLDGTWPPADPAASAPPAAPAPRPPLGLPAELPPPR
jgi:cobalt-zinc-cadmium efflux system outer membrane protein